ncbi:heat shock protein HspQ [Nocardia sp. CS682]|uniref:heat shock protein HspQ n=1 Tax=Nocardia sp. CS682 TaxID=1047172 RepID=UPI001074E623|nr:heat shock protein HspQ [Nocardia sp. CS682]QBS43619.1 heat shock protein HspQ [Nocardia sp. CS682]
MTEAKFAVGDRVRHVSIGRHGVVVAVDTEYSPAHDENDLSLNPSVRDSPWYRVTLEDENGQPVETYLSESQIDSE